MGPSRKRSKGPGDTALPPFFTEAREFATVLDKRYRTPEQPLFLQYGYYAEQIDRYVQYFDRSRIKIVFFDDLTKNSGETIHELFRFLDLRAVPIRDLCPANRPMPSVIHHLFWTLGRLPGATRLLSRWRDAFKRALAARFTVAKRLAMDPKTRSWLAKHYLSHNRNLQQMTGRDLSHWK